MTRECEILTPSCLSSWTVLVCFHWVQKVPVFVPSFFWTFVASCNDDNVCNMIVIKCTLTSFHTSENAACPLHRNRFLLLIFPSWLPTGTPQHNNTYQNAIKTIFVIVLELTAVLLEAFGNYHCWQWTCCLGCCCHFLSLFLSLSFLSFLTKVFFIFFKDRACSFKSDWNFMQM